MTRGEVRTTEMQLRDEAEQAYVLARKVVYDVEAAHPGVPRTEYQEHVIAALNAAEARLRQFREQIILP
jgi:hypothetical protein